MGRLSFSRLKTIFGRQYPAKFGSSYVPSMMVTRSEAPSKSRPFVLRAKKPDREVHVMSVPERTASLLALIHPNVVEIHEQKVMWPWASPHPLVGMPGIDSTGLPSVRGTIDVCERLGYKDLHPTIAIDNPDGDGKIRAPYPFLGDLLLFIRVRRNVYCVNWNIKDKYENFTAPAIGKRTASSKKDKRRGLARFEIENEYYADAEIRTVAIAAKEDIDHHVAANLSQAFPYTSKKTSLDKDQERRVRQSFIAALENNIPPNEVMASQVLRCVCTEYECRVIFYKAIWDRHLRVDWFSPILIDYPLVPEKKDIIEVYGDWFKP